MLRSTRRSAAIVSLCSMLTGSLPALAGDDPFADAWVVYDPGDNPAGGYTDPATTLGSPERFTGEWRELHLASHVFRGTELELRQLRLQLSEGARGQVDRL